MEELSKKVRRLTISERKQLLEAGYSILNTQQEQEDEVVIKILSMVFSDEDLEKVVTVAEENQLLNKIIKLTYGISEEDSKN